MTPRRVKIILAAILLVGGVFRFGWLDRWPPGLHPDELVIGESAYSIAKTGTDYRSSGRPPLLLTGLSPNFDNRTSVLSTYSSALLHLLLPPSPWAVRLPVAIVGTLTIWLVFLWARLVFRDDAVALTSSAVLAFSPYHIYYSRFTNDAVMAIALIIGGAILFRLALDRNRIFLFVCSAALLGLTAYSYMTYKLLTPLLVVILLATHWTAVRRHRRGILVWLAAGLAVILPSVILHVLKWNTINTEFTYIHAGSATTSPLFILKNYAAFFWPNFWAGPRTTLILDGLLAILGLGWLIRTRHASAGLMAAWFLWFPAAAAVTDIVWSNPNVLRGSSWLTIMPLLAGAGAMALARRVRREPQLAIIAGVLALALLWVSVPRVIRHWKTGDTPTCCSTWGGPTDPAVISYVASRLATERELVVGIHYKNTPAADHPNSISSTWNDPMWQHGLAFAYLLRFDPRVVQAATYEQHPSFSFLQYVTRVGPIRVCDLADCYQPNDGKLYVVSADVLTDLPGEVIAQTPSGKPIVRAVRNTR